MLAALAVGLLATIGAGCSKTLDSGDLEEQLTAPNGDEVRVDVTLTDDEGGFKAVVPEQQFK